MTDTDHILINIIGKTELAWVGLLPLWVAWWGNLKTPLPILHFFIDSAFTPSFLTLLFLCHEWFRSDREWQLPNQFITSVAAPFLSALFPCSSVGSLPWNDTAGAAQIISFSELFQHGSPSCGTVLQEQTNLYPLTGHRCLPVQLPSGHFYLLSA